MDESLPRHEDRHSGQRGRRDLIFLLAIVMIVNSPGDDQQPSVEPSAVTRHEPVKHEPVKQDTPSTAVLQLYEFDPKSLTTASDKAAYELGMKQGGSIVARYYAEVTKANPHPTQDQLRTHVKNWLQARRRHTPGRGRSRPRERRGPDALRQARTA